MIASELRIGNFVEVHCNCDCHKPGEIIMHFAPCCDKPVDVISILGVVENPNLTGVGVLGKGRLHKIETVYPIPLTEEWLVKFGFEDSKRVEPARYKNIPHSDLTLCWHQSDGVYLSARWMDEVIYFDCEHVHQLQNLYFALVGEELTLRES